MSGKNLFNSVKVETPKKNVFDLSHDVKTTTGFGRLTPILNMPCIPGDKINISQEVLLRFMPMISPVMHRMDVYVHNFFVPYRILWQHWDEFISGNIGGDPTFQVPTIQVGDGDTQPGTLANYLGLPVLTDPGAIYSVSAFPFAAYQKILDNYYKDQNLSVINTNDQPFLIPGSNNSTYPWLQELGLRSWEHDYFTSCLPWAQKGTPVDIPVTDVTITLDPDWYANREFGVNPGFLTEDITREFGNLSNQVSGPGQDSGIFANDLEEALAYNPAGSLLGSGGAVTINDLREALKIQEWLEKNARSGTRFNEFLMSHFGVDSPDSRLQRPEYIGGIKAPVTVSEVLNSTGESGGLPQGNMAGHGIGVTVGNAGTYNVQEHGVIIGILSVLPKTAYQNGIDREWLKTDPLDFFFPEFAHLGEQPVYQYEVFADDNPTETEGTFGYVPRFSEYKFMNNKVTGQLATSLNFWHLGRRFNDIQNLNEAFIVCDPIAQDLNRIFAVEEGDPFVLHCLNKVSAVRPMPKYGTPTF